MIHVDIVPSSDPTVIYYASNEDKERVGYCIIGARMQGPVGGRWKEAVIYHLYIDEKHRRKGYGKDLFDTIVGENMIPEGRKLMLAAGFIRDGLYFRWTKTNGVKH